MANVEFTVSNAGGANMLRVISRRRWLFAFTYVLIVLATAAYCFFWPPSYAAGVSFLLKRDREEPILSSDEHSVRTMSRQMVTEEDLNNEAALIQSSPVLEQTVQDLHIAQIPEHWLIRLVNVPLNFATSVYNDYHHRPGVDTTHAAMNRLARKVEVTPGKKSDILEVKVLWGDPDFARRIVERMSDHYMARHERVNDVPDTQSFYLGQLNRARAQLADVEGRIEAVHPGALLGGLQTEKDVSLRQAADFEAEWRKARARAAEVNARVNSRTEDLKALPDRIVTEDKAEINQLALGNLKTQVLDLELKRSQLIEKYKPQNRLVKRAEDDLARARSTLDAESKQIFHEQTTSVNKVAEAVKQALYIDRGENSSIAAGEAALKYDADSYKAQLNRMNRDAAIVQTLNLDRQAAQETVLQYARRYEEARIHDQMNKTHFLNVVPIEPVWALYSPVKPNTTLMLKLALILGLIVAFGFTFAVELMYGRVYDGRDLTDFIDVPVVACLESYKPMTSAGWTGM